MKRDYKLMQPGKEGNNFEVKVSVRKGREHFRLGYIFKVAGPLGPLWIVDRVMAGLFPKLGQREWETKTEALDSIWRELRWWPFFKTLRERTLVARRRFDNA